MLMIWAGVTTLGVTGKFSNTLTVADDEFFVMRAETKTLVSITAYIILHVFLPPLRR